MKKAKDSDLAPAGGNLLPTRSEATQKGERLAPRGRVNADANSSSLFSSLEETLEVKKTLLALWVVNSNLTNPKIEDALNFANTDSFDEASKVIFADLDKKGLRKVYEEIELPLIPITEKMESHGIRIDRAHLAHLAKTYHTEVARLEKEIWKAADKAYIPHRLKAKGRKTIIQSKKHIILKHQKRPFTLYYYYFFYIIFKII